MTDESFTHFFINFYIKFDDHYLIGFLIWQPTLHVVRIGIKCGVHYMKFHFWRSS